MSLINSEFLVDVPVGEGVHIKTAGAKKEKYVYKYIKYFRNADGQPRNKAKSIGKFDLESGKMIPNKNYYELFDVSPSASNVDLSNVDVWDYGYSYIATKTCKDMGLLDCLTRSFGSKLANDLFVMASYMVKHGSVMDQIDDWLQRNHFSNYSTILSSQSTSKIFASISNNQTNKFFNEWIKTALGDRAVCYDVTSISSYSQTMPSIEFGYNRDHDKLAQLNLGMFCDEINKTPIYYNSYNGSLTDRTNLSYALDNAKSVGIGRVKLVVDGGFMDKINISSLQEMCDSFILGLPSGRKDAHKIIETFGANIKRYENELNIPHTHCIPIKTEIEGVYGQVFLYFDALQQVYSCDELSQKINRLKSELATLKRYPKNNLKKYEPYFILTKNKNDNGFTYKVNYEKVEQERKMKGFFLLFTNDLDASAKDTLTLYREKDSIEKMFFQIKYVMEGNRIRTHNEPTTNGKIFVVFLACIIRSYLLRMLHQYLIDSSTSLDKALNQLSNIMIISDSNGKRLAKALTKKQKLILKSFNAENEILQNLS